MTQDCNTFDTVLLLYAAFYNQLFLALHTTSNIHQRPSPFAYGANLIASLKIYQLGHTREMEKLYLA